MHGGNGNLRSPREIQLVSRRLVDLSLIGGKEACPVHGLLPYQHWGNDRNESLGLQAIDRKLDEGELEQSPLASQEGEPGSSNLGRPADVDDVQRLAESEMILGLELEVRDLAYRAQHQVGVVPTTGRGLRVDEVRKGLLDLVDLLRNLCQLRLSTLEIGRDLLGVGNCFGTFILGRVGNCLAGPVVLGPQLFDFPEQAASTAVERG